MKNILILGAGFGGLRAATQIAKKLKRLGFDKEYEVILIDKNEHHTYTPLLYEVATTSRMTANLYDLHSVATHNIKEILGNSGIKFIKEEITKIDIEKGQVHLKNGSASRDSRGNKSPTTNGDKISCDYAVIALGSEINYFGIKGLRENSIPLKEFVNAVEIRNKVWSVATDKQRDTTTGRVEILIGGGGSTGTELAGELKAWCGELETEPPKCKLNVKIVEGGPSVLAGFPSKIIERVENRLRKLNIEVIAGKRIVETTKKEVVLDDGQKIPFDVLIWSGGIKAPSILTKIPLKSEQKGRVLVEKEMNVCVSEDKHLHVKPRIYGVGDSMCFYNPLTGKPIPGVARAAISQANIAAHNLIEDILTEEHKNTKPRTKNGEPRYKQYRPMDYPYIIPVGGKWAVAKIGPFIISGFSGWVLKGLVELNYLLSIMPISHTIKIWLKGLKIFIKNDRLG